MRAKTEENILQYTFLQVLLCGLLAVRALRLVKPHLDPALAFRLAMDSAIDAAKVPLAENALPD